MVHDDNERVNSIDKRNRLQNQQIMSTLREYQQSITQMRTLTNERFDDCDRHIRRHTSDIMVIRERLASIGLETYTFIIDRSSFHIWHIGITLLSRCY
jgi:hypothetical protein